MYQVLKIFFLLFVLFSTTLFAEELIITSERLDINRKDATSTFYGNVHVIEEGMEIWADKLLVTQNSLNNEIKEIYAENNVKIIRADLTAIGDNGLYLPLEESVQLSGNVTILEKGNTIHCDELLLDMKNSSSIMKSNLGKRVEATIINN
tara:strand:- start:145 stop:594 length:450 start_codon:yes stop_codon:yes gene_type:complete